MINNLCHVIDMYRGVTTLNKLNIIDGERGVTTLNKLNIIDGMRKRSVILHILRQIITFKTNYHVWPPIKKVLCGNLVYFLLYV